MDLGVSKTTKYDFSHVASANAKRHLELEHEMNTMRHPATSSSGIEDLILAAFV